jgi:hypothetical protein
MGIRDGAAVGRRSDAFSMPMETGTRCVYVASFSALKHHCPKMPEVEE